MLWKKKVEMVMVCNWYSHIVRVFITDRFYREAKRVARNERNGRFCRSRTKGEILSVCARYPLRLVFSVVILPWSSDTDQPSAMKEEEQKGETEAGRVS